MDADDKKREQTRVRMERYRSNKVQVSFTTSREVKEGLEKIAADHGYSTIKEFMEALTKGYMSVTDEN